MSFRPLYHPDVAEDIRSINRNLQIRIEQAIAQRLCVAPQAYGKPLAATLAGYWKLRVGDYRVVFKVHQDEIWIFGILNRRDVYSEIAKRLSWKP